MSSGTLSRIITHPGIRSGQPVIRGTRTTVEDILSLAAAGASTADILVDFPWLAAEDVEAALQWKAGDD